MENSLNAVEERESNGHACSYESTPNLPSFEGINVEDRPLPPPADDYPLGCEVELRDVDFAKVAQESRHWEPFMNEIFAVPRRVVRVCRHLGDYTFVQCADVAGMELVGCTLYRACLSEPKVKTTKYFMNLGPATEVEEEEMHELYSAVPDDLFNAATTTHPGLEDDFGAAAVDAQHSPLRVAVTPRRTNETHRPAPRASEQQQENGTYAAFGRRASRPDTAPRVAESRKTEGTTWGDAPRRPAPRRPSRDSAAVDRVGGSGASGGDGSHTQRASSPHSESDARRRRNDGAMVRVADGVGARVCSAAVTRTGGACVGVEAGGRNGVAANGACTTAEATLRAHNRFATAMRKGTQELNQHNYEKALRYYNAALRECPDEEARVLSSRSVAHLLLRQTDNALADAKRVIELQPESYIGYVRAGNILRGMKLMSDAQVFYKKAHRRDPRNLVIQRLLLSNSVAMLYDPRVRHCSKFKITYDSVTNRVIAVARQTVRAQDIVLKERTPLAAVLGAAACFATSPLTDDAAASWRNANCSTSLSTSHGTAPQPGVMVCQQCFTPLVRVSDICRHTSALDPQTMRSLHADVSVVPCSYECGSVYCSSDCRSRAWADHHWVQCPVRGRWSVGVRGVEAALARHLACGVRTPCGGVAVDDGEASLNSVNARSTSARENSTEGASVAEAESAEVMVACVRVTVRMLARMLSSVWTLRDAVHMYDWVRVLPVVEAQRGSAAVLLRPCYEVLSQSFLAKEKPKLSYELFERCYERVKSNAMLLRVSVWGKILFRAESYLALMGADRAGHVASPPCPSLSVAAVLPRLSQLGDESHVNGTAPQSTPPPPRAGSGATGTDALAASLRLVINAPPEGLPGTHAVCLCFFELFATTIDGARVADKPATAHGVRSRVSSSVDVDANVEVKNAVELAACIHLCTTRSVVKGERFVTRPVSYGAGKGAPLV